MRSSLVLSALVVVLGALVPSAAATSERGVHDCVRANELWFRTADGVRRMVPSGGALYPLELYVLALDLEEVEQSVLHYHPFRHRLETLGPLAREVSKEDGVRVSLPSAHHFGHR